MMLLMMMMMTMIRFVVSVLFFKPDSMTVAVVVGIPIIPGPTCISPYLGVAAARVRGRTWCASASHGAAEELGKERIGVHRFRAMLFDLVSRTGVTSIGQNRHDHIDL